jgi:hypothetical protein
MINRIESVSNEHVCVVYSYLQQGVLVHTIDNARQRIFGGYPQLLERYRELADNFSAHIDYTTACNHFTLHNNEYCTDNPR